MILTNDGRWNERLRRPESGIEKEYRVGFRGALDESAVARCARGMRIEGYEAPTLPAELVLERAGRFRTASRDEELGLATLVLREGRHHQVRRMFRALGANVVELHRERIGGYRMPGGLAPGDYIALSRSEVVGPVRSRAAARAC